MKVTCLSEEEATENENDMFIKSRSNKEWKWHFYLNYMQDRREATCLSEVEATQNESDMVIWSKRK